MTTSVILGDVSQQLFQTWDCGNEDSKRRIHEQYMKIFADVWRESVPLFDKVVNCQNTKETPYQQESQEMEDETEDKTEELEDHLEAATIIVAKKRREYPSHISAYLGKRRRLQKNSIEVMKVECPLRTPLEIDVSSYATADLSFKDLSSDLSESLQHLQPHLQRLGNLADAVDILKLNHGQSPEEICSKSL